RAMPCGGRPPGPPLDATGVVPQSPLEVAQLRGRHPQGVEPDVRVGTEVQVLAQRAIHGELRPGPSLRRPRADARLATRLRMPDRIAPAAVEAETVGGAPAGGERGQQQAAVVAAEIVGALAQADREAAECVRPGNG